MVLPQKCPLDGTSGCKKKDCHLYHIDWRSGDENCMLGYGNKSKEEKKGHPIEDNYAHNTRDHFENKEIATDSDQEDASPTPDRTGLVKEKTDAPDTRDATQNKNPLHFLDRLPENYEEKFWN